MAEILKKRVGNTAAKKKKNNEVEKNLKSENISPKDSLSLISPENGTLTYRIELLDHLNNIALSTWNGDMYVCNQNTSNAAISFVKSYVSSRKFWENIFGVLLQIFNLDRRKDHIKFLKPSPGVRVVVRRAFYQNVTKELNAITLINFREINSLVTSLVKGWFDEKM